MDGSPLVTNIVDSEDSLMTIPLPRGEVAFMAPIYLAPPLANLPSTGLPSMPKAEVGQYHQGLAGCCFFSCHYSSCV